MSESGFGVVRRVGSLFAVIVPGLVLAATGVGAGDLATGALAGSRLGMAVLWAVVLGAALKFVLNEGIARYQLSTGETVLEGICLRLGWFVPLVFGVYLVLWSLWVGRALMVACGVTAAAVVPLGIDGGSLGLPGWVNDRNVWAVLHALLACGFVWFGGFKLFSRVMSVAVALMFVGVIATALALRPDVGAVMSGLFVPRIPEAASGGLGWTVALMGGVGGTLTILCYSYWIREAGRSGLGDLVTCRVDLAVGYAATMAFGLSMVVIAAGLVGGGEAESGGVGLILSLSWMVGDSLNEGFRWVFLIGAWAAMVTSLVGVLQAVPYVIADYVHTMRHGWGVGVARDESLALGSPSTGSRAYRWSLLLLTVLPMAGLGGGFAGIQKVYAVFGACFVPFLAGALLVLNGGRRSATRGRNGWGSVVGLWICLGLAVLAGGFEVARRVFGG